MKDDLLCFSHLRWGFVYQRPNHLMARWAAERRVFFFEEPIYHDGPDRLEMHEPVPWLHVVTPYLKARSDVHERTRVAARPRPVLRNDRVRLLFEARVDLVYLLEQSRLGVLQHGCIADERRERPVDGRVGYEKADARRLHAATDRSSRVRSEERTVVQQTRDLADLGLQLLIVGRAYL